MEWDYLFLGKVLGLFLISTVKFSFAPIAALTTFSVLQTIIITSAGGCTGVLVFFLLSTGFQRWSAARRHKLEDKGAKKPKRNFTRTNKTIVKVKRAFGLPGIAFLTLPLISVPLCAIITAKFYRHRKEALPMLIISVLVWSVTLTYLFSLISLKSS